MPSLNKVMIIGNLTRDPELRYTPKGAAVADLALAINRTWKDESGAKHEEVTYVGVVLWARLAELAHEYLTKGNPVFIEGRLQQETWDDKETGKKRSKTKVVGESMQFLGTRPRGDGGGHSEDREDRPPPRNAAPPTAMRQQSAPPPRDNSQAATEQQLEEDDIPF